MADRPPHENDKADGSSAYAGRWIARLWDRIVGQGGTPKQAMQAAKSNRFKEKPQVSYVPTSSPLTFPPLVEQVQGVLPKRTKVYLVGGAVRDAILHQESNDLDFAVEKDALKIARKVANALEGAYYRMDEEHETGRVILKQAGGARFILDFAVFRQPDLEDDLRGRDFTINAMAVDLRSPQELLDPLGGLNDLFNKQLRACSSSAFSDDPVRILRAIRFAAKLNLKMTPETRGWLKDSTGEMTKPSEERIRDELFKILDIPQIATSIRALAGR